MEVNPEVVSEVASEVEAESIAVSTVVTNFGIVSGVGVGTKSGFVVVTDFEVASEVEAKTIVEIGRAHV